MAETFKYLQLILGIAGFLALVIFVFIVPAVKAGRRIRRDSKSGVVTERRGVEVLSMMVMPLVGYGFLLMLRTDLELLDWKYLPFILALYIVSVIFYFLSRRRKDTLGPLALALIPTFLLTGIVIVLAQFIHFAPIVSLTVLGATAFLPFTIPFALMALPAFALLQVAILMSFELFNILRYNRNKFFEAEEKKNWMVELKSFYFGKNAILHQILTFPVFATVVQIIVLLFTDPPGGVVQAFTESSDGLFSRGWNDNHVSHPEYLCTIAAYGNPKLVKPLHTGYRHGQPLLVTRQLQVCNAFEELLTERAPNTQRFLRKVYDGMQIPIHRWKSVRFISNMLYILLKPLEWSFLLAIYFLEPDPEIRIGKQYLSLRENEKA